MTINTPTVSRSVKNAKRRIDFTAWTPFGTKKAPT